MLSSILNLEGVTVLTKKQQKSLKGGQTCRITLTFESGNVRTVDFNGFSEGESGSSEANDFCVNAILNPLLTIDACAYDCSYDGYEQQ